MYVGLSYPGKTIFNVGKTLMIDEIFQLVSIYIAKKNTIIHILLLII